MLCPHCQAPNSEDARFCGACGRATSLTEPVSDPRIGEAPTLLGRVIAGRYRVLAKLGEGGMGAVFQAEQISLKRTVAIKLLRPDVSASPMLLRRFNAEAEAVAKLRHPNTVNIYDFGQDTDGTLFIAMELIEGRSLRSVVHREAPLPVRRALGIAAQVAASLADAHQKTIVHRDLKPDNVMLTDRGRSKDNVTVLDFGIAKLRDESRATQQMTQAGDVLGTPQYMAPEQIRGEHIDGRTDVYALGCMIYEMITGRLPFEAPSVMALLSKHLVEQAPPPSQRRPDLGLPPMVDDLVMGAMAKDPAARPPTMDDYGERIAAVLVALPPDQASQRSGVVGASSALAPIAHVDTPAAYSVPTFAPRTPPPPTSPPPRTPPPPTSPPPLGPGFGPPGPPPGFGPPGHAAPPFSAAHPASFGPGPGYPPPGRPPHPTPFPPGHGRTGGSSRLPWILVAALALGGGGTGVYFATRGPGAKSVADSHDDHGDHDKADPDRPDPDRPDPPKREPDKWDHKHDAGVADPDEHDSDDSDPSDHDSDDSGSESSSSSPTIAGTTVDVAQGVKIIAPPGMAVTRQGGAVQIGDPSSFAIVAAPITEKTVDPDSLARTYAKQSGLKLYKSDTGLIAGAQRKIYAFAGMVNGVPVVHIGLPLIGRGYKVAVIVHMAGAVVTNEAAMQTTVAEVLGRRLIVPSAAH